MIKVGDLVRVKTTAASYNPRCHNRPLRVVSVYPNNSIVYVGVEPHNYFFFYLDDVEHVTSKPDASPEPRVTKGEILDQAKVLITGNREDDYGDAAENFGNIAKMWSVIFGIDVQPYQVAFAMDSVKTCRLIKTPDHVDSWVDMAGYVGLAGELALNGE